MYWLTKKQTVNSTKTEQNKNASFHTSNQTVYSIISNRTHVQINQATNQPSINPNMLNKSNIE